jgi:hypothetical protein
MMMPCLALAFFVAKTWRSNMQGSLIAQPFEFTYQARFWTKVLNKPVITYVVATPLTLRTSCVK